MNMDTDQLTDEAGAEHGTLDGLLAIAETADEYAVDTSLPCYRDNGCTDQEAADCENDWATFHELKKAARLTVLRRIRDRLARTGAFKDWCRDHRENYQDALNALHYADHGRGRRADLNVKSERQLPAPEPETAEQTTLDDVSPYATKVIESWEGKARVFERKLDATVKQAEELAKEVARLKAGNALELAHTDFDGTEPLRKVRPHASSADYTEEERREMRQDVRWTVTRSVLSGIKAMAVPTGDTVDHHSEWLFEEIPWDFLPNVRAEDFESALLVLQRWITYIRERTPEPAEQSDGEAAPDEARGMYQIPGDDSHLANDDRGLLEQRKRLARLRLNVWNSMHTLNHNWVTTPEQVADYIFRNVPPETYVIWRSDKRPESLRTVRNVLRKVATVMALWADQFDAAYGADMQERKPSDGNSAA